jgi:hypothetical protein
MFLEGKLLHLFPMAQQPLVDQGLLSIEASRSHSDTPPLDSSERVISPTQRPLHDNTQQSQETAIPPAGFEPTIPASERPQTHASDRAAPRIGKLSHLVRFNNIIS